MPAAVRNGSGARPASASTRSCALALCLLALPALAATPAHAQAGIGATQHYDIPSGALTAAVNRFARQAGVALSFDPSLAQDRRTGGLQGSYGVAEGFAALLAGSGLAAVRNDNGSWTLIAGQTSAAVQLAPVRVQGAATPEDATLRAAGTVSTVTRERLDRFAPTSASDLFKDIPGVLAVNARNGGSFDVNIRGMQGDRVKVLVDGTQSTTNTSKSYGGEGNHNYVDPDLVGAMRVEKGPATGPYGAGTGGGVVHLDTLTAADLIVDDKEWGVRLRGGVAGNGSDGRGFVSYDGTTALDRRTPGDNTSGSVAGAWRGFDGDVELVAVHSQRRQGNYYAGTRGPQTWTATWDDGNSSVDYELSKYGHNAEVFNTSQDMRSTLLKARAVLPQEQWLELSYNRFDSEFGESRLTSFDYNIEQKPLGRVDKSTWLLRHGWQPASGGFWNLRSNVWSVKVDEAHPEILYTEASSITRTRGAELWNLSALSFAGIELDLSYGGSYQNERTEGMGITEPRGERDLYGLFAQAQARIAPWLSLDAGLRHEAYTTDGTGSFISPVPGQNPIPYTVADGHERLNSSIGLTVTPWAPASLYLRYSEGWRPPTPKEVGLTYGNERDVLQPEITRSIEVGSRFAFDGLISAQDRLHLTLAWFDNRHRDYLARSLGSGSAGYFYFNIDGARFRGIEFDLRYDAGPVFASYGINHYSKAQFCGFLEPQCTDRFVSNFGLVMFGLAVPPKQVQTATLGLRLLDRRLTLGLRATFADEAVGALSANTGQPMSHGWRPYEVHDLFGSFRFNDALDVGFSIDNQRDRYYVETMSSPSIAIPAPGRTAKATLTYRF